MHFVFISCCLLCLLAVISSTSGTPILDIFYVPNLKQDETLVFLNESVSVLSFHPTTNCTSPKSCSYNGYCIDVNTCKCDDGYTTHDSTPNISCNYKQKDRLVAFLLQFFLFSVGAGNFYLGNIGLAVGQLFYYVGSFIFLCIVMCGASCCFIWCDDDSNRFSFSRSRFGSRQIHTNIDDDHTGKTLAFSCCYCLFVLGMLIWFVIETVYIGDGTRLDGNGVKTYGM